MKIVWGATSGAAKRVWTGPNTVLGLAAGVLLLGRCRLVEGVIEIHGGGVTAVLRRFPVPAMAMTLGHVVWGQSEAALDMTREHERVHVRQYERWGPFFLPAYLAASGWLWMRRDDPYRGNPFEREAFAEDARRLRRA